MTVIQGYLLLGRRWWSRCRRGRHLVSLFGDSKRFEGVLLHVDVDVIRARVSRVEAKCIDA